MSRTKKSRKTRSNPPETRLYSPVREFLEKQGYVVRAEVHGCDVVGTKGADVVVVELKKAIELSLLVQAVDRQRLTDSVYLAVPRPSSSGWARRSRGVLHLLRRLELGLIFVSRRVEIVLHPEPFQRRKSKGRKRALLDEFAGRSGDFNVGGSTRRKLVTAYRENAIHIATVLRMLGPSSTRVLRSHGTGPKTTAILYDNVYGWFERVNRGVYGLTRKGADALSEYPDLVTLFEAALPSNESGNVVAG